MKNCFHYIFSFSFLLLSAECFSQEKKEGLPITVSVITSMSFVDGSVALKGTSASMDEEAGLVHIEVIKPDGGTDNITSRADASTGEYNCKYMPVKPGTYKVIAYASDKIQTASANFTVSAAFDADEVLETFDKARDKSLAAIESSLNKAMAGEVAADDVAKTKAAINKLKQKIKAFDAPWDKLKASLKTLGQICKKYADVNTIAAPSLGQLGSKLKQSSDLVKQVEKSLGTDKSNQSDICNRFYQISESCALFSTAMNMASGGIVDIGKSIFIDKVWPKIAEKVGPKNLSANDNFAFTQAGKTGLSALDDIKSLGSTSFGAGMAGDFVQYLSGELFKKYCTQYKGPVSGDYTLEFKNEGKTYMKYTLYYAGTVSLYCKKEKLKGSLPKLSGYLEGNVNKVDFTDDVWAVEDKSDWDEIKYQRIPAPVIPINMSEADPGFGAAARSSAPGSFYFPLQAQMVENKVVIKLMPALSDFTDAFANQTVVVARAKYGAKNVAGAVFQYPVTTARFILTRAMHMPDASPTVTIDMKTKNGITTVEKEFTRSEAPGETKVDFHLKLKMIND